MTAIKSEYGTERAPLPFRLDDKGKPIEVYVKERKDAHMLIEDFMLLANREVATFIQQKGADQGRPAPDPPPRRIKGRREAVRARRHIAAGPT